LKDKKQHIDKLFGDKLKELQPKVMVSDWEAIASKMKAQHGATFGEQVKNLTPGVSDGDWKAIVSKMPPASQNQKVAWWWLPLFIAFVIGAYPLLNKLDKSIHFQETQNQALVLNNQSEENNATSTATPSKTQNQALILNNQSKENNATSTGTPLNKNNDVQEAAGRAMNNIDTRTSSLSNNNTPKKSAQKNASSKSKKPDYQKKITPISQRQASIIQDKNTITENPIQKLNLHSTSLKSLYEYQKNSVGLPLSLIGEFASWPKIIEPNKAKPDLLNNLSFSPIVSLNRYSSNFISDDANWQNKRTQAEKAVVLPDMGLKVNTSKGKIALNTGLIYSIKGQQINGDVTYQLYDSFPHLDPSGVLIDYFRLNYRDTTVKVKLTNTYSYIDIPLNIGYQFKLGKKHSFTPTLGTTLSFFTRAKGQSIAPNLGFHDIADNSLYNYRKLMSSWQVQMNYNYLITDKIQFETGIQYRKNINGIYSSSYDAKERLMNLGLSFGLNYKF
jgi:hypothetical protein